MELIKIGVVTKPQALKGEFRVKPSILNLKTFKKLTSVSIDGIEYPVEKVILRDAFAILKLNGIDTCEQAETLRNREVFAMMEIDIEEHFDLVNFEVLVDNHKVGTISSVDNYGSKDILSISGEKNLMLPVIDKLIINIDKDTKVVSLNKEIFEQVAVYED